MTRAKRLKKSAIFFVLFFSGWIFSACKKEKSIESADVSSNFTAVIDGAQWSAARTSEDATLLQGMLNITGISADSQEISMTLTDTSLGVHMLSPQTTSLAAYGSIDPSSGATFSTSEGVDSTQAGGEVTVTQINKLNNTVSGTFSFVVYRSSDGQQRTIASGVFTNIPYTTSLPGSNTGDTVSASIDGATYTSQSIDASIQDAQLTILGSTSNANQSIALIIPTNATVGTHALTPSGATPAYLAVYDFVSSNGNNTAAPANAGSINILENNAAISRIRGTFSFTTADGSAGNTDHTITGGFFSVYYGQ